MSSVRELARALETLRVNGHVDSETIAAVRRVQVAAEVLAATAIVVLDAIEGDPDMEADDEAGIEDLHDETARRLVG